MTKIKEFYTERYPGCDRGKVISRKATFEGLTDDVIKNNLFEYLNVAHEVVLERIMQQLAIVRGVEYSEVYKVWAGSYDVANGVLYRLDWNCDGCIRMHKPKTVDLYHKLKYEFQAEMHECFFAFNSEQFAKGVKENNLEGKKLYRTGAGMFGTKEGIEDFFNQYKEPDRRIKEECIPQEVYFFEYNNHECMINWDGDLEPIKLIISIWGEDVAKTIVRRSVNASVDEIVNNKKLW